MFGRGILAGGLAERCRAGLVQSRMSSTTWNSRPARLAKWSRLRSARRRQRVAGMGAEQHGGADQRAGLVDVHEFEFRLVKRLADRGEIDGLAAGHAARAAGVGQQGDHFELACRTSPIGWLGQQLEGQRLQAVADQQGGRLVVLDVAGRLAAAQHVVVHARQVVMHQRIGVDQFDGAGDDVEPVRCRRRSSRRRRGRAAGGRACRRRAWRSAWPRAGVPGAVGAAGSKRCERGFGRAPGWRPSRSENPCSAVRCQADCGVEVPQTAIFQNLQLAVRPRSAFAWQCLSSAMPRS